MMDREQLSPEQVAARVAQLQAELGNLQAHHPELVNPQVPKVKPPKPSTYKGERDVLAWTFKLERYFDAVGLVSDRDMCNFAASLLDGMAANWLRCILHGGSLIPQTWNDFKIALVRQFQPLADEEDARQKLMRLTQRKSVRQYVQLFLDTVMRLPDMHEKDRLFRFKEGLKLPCREWVVRARANTLLEAMTAAEEWEQIHLGEKSRDNAARFRAREADRASSAEPMQLGAAKGSRGKSSNTPKANNGQGKDGDRKGDGKKTVRKCFICDKPGHIAKDCWHKKGSSKPKVNATNGGSGDSDGSSSEEEN